ncbi:hypothetical protein ABCS02_25390 [Microbacterium sp. X-17]|uniref:hypothetical protein n=1 Tax=Microbacterium sp. X-17 TaxID=3144404 RepID=UPI0031F53813
MGFLDRLFGSDEQRPKRPTAAQTPPAYAQTPQPAAPQQPLTEDELAIQRYRYLLRTAPPETIEQVHAEAFARLTDAQRQQVLADLSTQLPPAERPRTDSPDDLARAATRAEYTNPGFMERSLGNNARAGGGPSFGSMLGTSILGAVIGSVVGSALVSAFVAPAVAADQGGADTGTDAAGADSGTDAGGTAGSDAGAADAGGTDAGSVDAAGWDGGFDGGDFGGGDFGGDFGF